jgi:uncharacterized membrane protein
MTLTPLLAASPLIQLHVAAAVAALGLTFVQLIGRKRSRAHRRVGYAWAGAMMLLALSGLFIPTTAVIGPFSPIHLLALLVLASVPLAVFQARAGKVRAHRRTVHNLIVFALLGAGAFTFWPGRLMHAVAFGG